MIGPPQEYHADAAPTLLTLFDLRDPEATERLYLVLGGLQDSSDIEVLDGDHCVLVVHAGGAKRLIA